eukprot:5274522-Prymnesium_polylepis.1
MLRNLRLLQRGAVRKPPFGRGADIHRTTHRQARNPRTQFRQSHTTVARNAQNNKAGAKQQGGRHVTNGR